MIADEVQKEPTNQLEIKTCWQNWFFLHNTFHSTHCVVLFVAVKSYHYITFTSFRVKLIFI